MFAQTPIFRQHVLKGAESTAPTVVFQDSRGWFWIGAEEGLYRYDGLSPRAAALPDTLSGVPVSALQEWDGKLWVGFKNGQIATLPTSGFWELPSSVADGVPAADVMHLWQPEEGTPGAAITAFVADPRGALWIATYGEGLYCWNNNRLFQFDVEDDGLAGNEIYALALDANGWVWAATDGGVSRCTMPAFGQKVVQNLTKADGLPDEIVTALTADPNGNVWIGTYDRGVCRYDVQAQRFDYFSADWRLGPVNALLLLGSRELWIGTAENGPVRLDLMNAHLQTLPEGHALRRSAINKLSKDREGWLWAVVDNKILYSSNVRYGLLETPDSEVQALCVDWQGRLWLGSPSGLHIFEKSAFRKIAPDIQNVLSIWQAPDGNMWVGTFGNGAYVLGPDERVLRRLDESNGLLNGSILSINGDSNRVWLATLGGVMTAEPTGENAPLNFSQEHGLGINYVYKVYIDSRKRVWFGTDGHGLMLWDRGALTHIDSAAGFPLHTVYAVVEDRKGNIWFSTDRTGLFSYDGSTFRHYDQSNRLHSLRITALATDLQGRLLIGYEDGMDLLNPVSGHLSWLGARNGVPAVHVALNALCRDAHGNLWAGTRQGALRIAAIDEAVLEDPQPDITGVSVFLKPIDFSLERSFSHDQNYFIFNFTGLWYTNPEEVMYRYRLENFDPDWKLTKDRLASYPKLPPGRYIFRMQASEHGSFVDVPEASWSFEIRLPFWRRWWFVTLSVLALAALLYAWVHARERRLQRWSLLKKEKAESEFAVLKSQINPHFLFNSFNTLISIIEENPRLAVEYVEQLADYYRNILVHREKDLISLQEEMTLVRNFCYLLEKRFENNFHLVERVGEHGGKIMPLSLQLLVENAVKHNIISSARPLTVEISIENDRFVVVRNNIQQKIKEEPGTHFGLKSLVNRYALLGAPPVVVEAGPDYFTVKIPLL